MSNLFSFVASKARGVLCPYSNSAPYKLFFYSNIFSGWLLTVWLIMWRWTSSWQAVLAAYSGGLWPMWVLFPFYEAWSEDQITLEVCNCSSFCTLQWKWKCLVHKNAWLTSLDAICEFFNFACYICMKHFYLIWIVVNISFLFLPLIVWTNTMPFTIYPF